MRKTILLAFLMLVSTNLLAADGFSAQVRGVTVKVQFYAPGIVRVLKTTESSNLENKKSFAVTMEPQGTDVSIKETAEVILATSSDLTVRFDRQSGKIEFSTPSGKALLAEKEYGLQMMPATYVQNVRMAAPQPAQQSGVQFTQSSPGHDTPGLTRGRMRTIVENTNEVFQSFILDEDEVIYGLGQHQNGRMNQRGQRMVLEQNNMEISIPYFASVKGYGVYWDNYSITTFDDSPMGTSFRSEAGEAVDYYFLYGNGADGTVALMRELTGQAPMVPLWTLGFWQCKERYKSQEEIVGVARKYRELGVPLDAVVQDWKYWGEEDNQWSAIEFLNPEFPDPDRMFRELEKLNAKMMITIWPSFGENSNIYRSMDSIGALMPMQTSPKVAKVYDPFNADARKIIWRYMNENMFSKGMSAWWMDGSEPEFYSTTQSDFNFQTGEGALRNVRNAFPLYVSKAIWDGQRATTDQKRVYILTRSGFAGMQRYGAGSWSGDVRASWEVFAQQIPAGLNYSLCGIPYWNSDIGAWHPFGHVYNNANEAPDYQQFYCRWFQFATFNPMMRSHGTGSPREIYQFGERGYWAFDVQEQYLNLRYSMLPYLYSTAWQVSDKGYSYLRQLSMEAPDDRNTWDINDEFMFGQAFLVAPVIEADAESRQVYLPSNTDWVDFWTGQRVKGGQTVTKETPIEIIPVYVKTGSIVPFTTEKVQYATEKSWKTLELRVYPGADGNFTLYEDENDNYNYEKGQFTEIPLSWNEATRELTIGARTGSFKGMLKSRKFKVTLAGEKASRTVSYNGKQIKVKM
ncbi:MAG: DUF5110 domain-containing protein [Bacteroidaceae bacterium]|nr:DUF5110 domain-containing protein [Bacteroidaceae bacterium]